MSSCRRITGPCTYWERRQRPRAVAPSLPIPDSRSDSQGEIENFVAQGRHNAWAQSTEDVQRPTMTKRRARRLNRCRPSIALDEHRHDYGDNNDGAQTMAAQNNNQHRQYVSFSRKIGTLSESQPIEFTQMRLDADRKQTTNDARQGATEARKGPARAEVPSTFQTP